MSDVRLFVPEDLNMSEGETQTQFTFGQGLLGKAS